MLFLINKKRSDKKVKKKEVDTAVHSQHKWITELVQAEQTAVQMQPAECQSPEAEIKAKQLRIYRKRQKDTLGILFMIKRFQL